MKELKRLIKVNQKFLAKYEAKLVADPEDFGAKLMVGNIRRHLADLQSQMDALLPSSSTESVPPAGSIAARSAF